MGGETMVRSMVVLGTSHRLQGAQNYKGSVNVSAYSTLVENLISTKRLDFIFEEASGTGPTHASKLAGAYPYLDVDPSPQNRKTHGLAEHACSSFIPIDLDDPNMSRDAYVLEYVQEQEQREEFWLRRIVEQNFSRGLMICGHLHTLSFAFRLRLAKFDVESLAYIPYHRLCSNGG
jgi:hypothetical protein